MSTTQLSVPIDRATQKALQKEVATAGCTLPEAVRRSVAVLNFIRDAEGRGDRIQVQHADGSLSDLVVIP